MPRQTRTLTASLILAAGLALPAAGQQETRVPYAAWESQFVGRYAVMGACDDPTAIWVLHPVAVQAGRLNCNGLGKMNWNEDEGTLRVPLTDCQLADDAVPPQTVEMRKSGEDGVIVTGLTIAGETLEPVHLRRCDGG